ncbi:hypothetical protein HGRIS_012585 [Hohenbuehelia grisea]|uniref:Extracellular membrane protein CFEM domain-containing protein n=1 Tax=Hohenbuehelia grisea TaxID=104357 RepID=A0ABR3ISZ5_9AGAR
MVAFFEFVATSVPVLLAAQLAVAAPASRPERTQKTSTLVARQTSPDGLTGSVPSIPPQCQSLCGAIVQTALNCKDSIPCICTNPNLQAAATCDGCLVVALNRQLAQFQASFDSGVAQCRAAGINVSSVTIMPNPTAGNASPGAPGAPGAAAPGGPGGSTSAPGTVAPGNSTGSSTPGSSTPGGSSSTPGSSAPAAAAPVSAAPASGTTSDASPLPSSSQAADDKKNGVLRNKAGVATVLGGALIIGAVLL